MLASLGFGYWEDWELQDKVTIDGLTKTISVNPGVVSLDIRTEVYSPYIDWIAVRDNTKFGLGMRFIGLDPIPGGQAGDIYFMTDGWKLVLDVAKVRVSGVLYSDDYPSAYYNYENGIVYPITVAALVNAITVKENIVTGTVPTPEAISSAVWDSEEAAALASDVSFIKDIESGRWVINEGTNQMIFYAADNTTEVARFALKDKSGNATSTDVFERLRL